jgi:hypothetical protein
MTSYNLLLIAGCAALGTLMLPIRQWQALLLWGLGGVLRLAGMAVIAAAVVVLVAGDGNAVVADWMHEVSWLDRNESLALAGLAVVGLFPLVTFLDFMRRLDEVARRSESLLGTVESTGLVMQAWVEQAEGPGAALTPDRRIELKSALDKLRGRATNGRPTVLRTTLAQLLK